MESVNVRLSPSDEEFESMMRVFNLAGDWMLEQLALTRQHHALPWRIRSAKAQCLQGRMTVPAPREQRGACLQGRVNASKQARAWSQPALNQRAILMARRRSGSHTRWLRRPGFSPRIHLLPLS
jgi:hypothetical protein